MPIFIKTEKFTEKTLKLSPKDRKAFLLMHKKWVEKIKNSGEIISSGYLVNEERSPGGGGLIVFEAKDYSSAKNLISNDPMILNQLVVWDLQEWIPINKNESLLDHLG